MPASAPGLPSLRLLVVLAAASVAPSASAEDMDCSRSASYLDYVLHGGERTATFFVSGRDEGLEAVRIRVYDYDNHWDFALKPSHFRHDLRWEEWYNVTVAQEEERLEVFVNGRIATYQQAVDSTKITHITVILKGEGNLTWCDPRGDYTRLQIALIASGVAAAVLLLMLVLLWCWCKRRRSL
ncbi:uncharacterized protein LOC119597993 [Penaeus monodon]|uniref:uncharacterized protein LOC119597993 n=1 Tax=Penaeus monodon TaxID=6687 RepID=UPI0018A77715|nr:uncharacterized protein LOC119597993 [Penaeus monodon]